MTLRRCDSLPTRLRELPVAPDPEFTQPLHKNLPESNTVPNFSDTPKLDEVITTWKSLHTDVKNIKNGLPSKNDPSSLNTPDGEFVTCNNISEYECVKNDGRRKLIFNNQRTGVCKRQNKPRCSSRAAVTQATTIRHGSSTARRRTLLERLLSWRTSECNCREKFTPKLFPSPKFTPEELLCTCGASRVNVAQKQNKYADRGRSKSVGYEATREVTQFRRCASAGATVEAETAAVLRARAALTLARRYYPEGGWGWTITIVGTLVQIISHGLQLGGGTGAIACTAAVKYRVPPLYSYGK
ncbi:unnamed protein product [Parnassius apollo]|uniref:(apollo) hypothetical protein n=1 Tax=Parnassius apollo TaxID=110799 RepID=A0A8S3XK34_PARAO|nr:unnamed protein product [Parnassius apollo]